MKTVVKFWLHTWMQRVVLSTTCFLIWRIVTVYPSDGSLPQSSLFYTNSVCCMNHPPEVKIILLVVYLQVCREWCNEQHRPGAWSAFQQSYSKYFLLRSFRYANYSLLWLWILSSTLSATTNWRLYSTAGVTHHPTTGGRRTQHAAL